MTWKREQKKEKKARLGERDDRNGDGMSILSDEITTFDITHGNARNVS